MVKKTMFSFLLISLFIAGFSHFSGAFSRVDVRLRVIKSDNNMFIRILTPLDNKKILGEIVSKNEELKAKIYQDSYGIVKENGNSYNEFIISSTDVRFTDDDKIKLFINDRLVEEYISAIPFRTIEFTDKHKVDSLKVMTYNISHGNNKFGLDTLDSIKKLIEEENIDIVGFQELDKRMLRSGFEDQIKELANSLSMYYAYGPNTGSLGGKYGNGILSKYPITDYNNIIMEGKENRGILKATIWLNGDSTNLIVTHLGLSKEEREKQFNILKSYSEIYKEDIILMGDLNTTLNDPNISKMENIIDDSAVKTASTTINTLNSEKNNSRIDYIFISERYNVDDYDVKRVDYSDHYPVIVNIKLP
ncbi:endonuclease/exonuclease/phosphatase family protein [Sporosalibacterium faouarense]|uniref:endonuclease/exonuclease/phosphatase family protein n=1 Tax=Sporosalibacterium faouarense TaxID=516123 RepID=UPI00192B9B4B